MKKKLIYGVSISTLLMLSACSATETEKVSGTTQTESTETTETVEKTEAVETDVAAEEESTETQEDINEVVVDNESYKITLLNILKKSDEIWGNQINVVFEVENKMDKTIGVQARSVSADGYMVDETIYSMSQEVVGGKKAKAILTINDFDGYDFPELNSDFEMSLHVFDYDTFDVIEDHEVKVTF